MFFPCKTHPFGNYYHLFACARFKVIYNVEIVEGKDRPRVMGKMEFEENVATAGLLVSTTNPLWWTGKVVVIYSDFCVLEGLISMVEKGVLGSTLIKKRRYWPKGVPEEYILRHMQNKEVGGMGAVKGSIIWKSYHIMAIKDLNYVVLTMTSYGKLENLEGLGIQRSYKGAGGYLVTKLFNYREVFGNHFD